MKLSVIMPMYNAHDISENLKSVIKSLDSFMNDYEIIVVNDGSTNSCFEEAKKVKSKKLRIIGYDKNKGKGNALKYGFDFAKGDYIAFLDTGEDLEAEQLKNFIRIMNKEDADIVIGSKRHPESIVHYPFMRRVMSRIYQTINMLLFNLNVKDTQVGIKLFKKEKLGEILPKIIVKKFAFDLELLVVAHKLGMKIVEAPIVMQYKFRSTINLRAVFWMIVDTAAIFYRLKILRYYD